MGVCSRLPRQLLPGQEVELLCSSQAVDPLQEIHSTRHLGKGVDTLLFLETSV